MAPPVPADAVVEAASAVAENGMARKDAPAPAISVVSRQTVQPAAGARELRQEAALATGARGRRPCSTAQEGADREGHKNGRRGAGLDRSFRLY